MDSKLVVIVQLWLMVLVELTDSLMSFLPTTSSCPPLDKSSCCSRPVNSNMVFIVYDNLLYIV